MPIARALDGRLAISYLMEMAARLLLTLLALLTGLAAPFTPAQARGCAADTEIGAIASERTGHQRAVSALPALERGNCRDWRADESRRPAQSWPAIVPPSVLLGIDRARE